MSGPSLTASKRRNTDKLNTLQKPGFIFRGVFLATTALLTLALPGCAVIAVVDTVGTVAVKTVGLAADAAIGAVKITGRAVGAAADAVIPGGTAP